jgi:hypothetical protein
MKKITLTTLLFTMFCISQSFSQVDFGIKMGVHSFELNNPKDLIFPNSEGSIKFSEAKLGFQGGIYTKINFANVFLEPRVMLHSTRVSYVVDGSDGGIIDNIKEESFTNLDIPLLLGFKLLLFDAVVGPVAHLNLDRSSDLFDLAGYDDRFDAATYGWRAGIGFSIGNLNLGVEYEGNFSKFGDDITIGGQDFSFDETPSRLIFNLGIRMF